MKLDRNSHSVFSLNFHLILVIKYRRKVLNDEILFRLKEIFQYICPNYNITLKDINHDFDYIHIVFSSHPKTPISKFINTYKSVSSRLIKKEFPAIKEKLYNQYFWTQSFCLISVGGDPLEILKTYVQSQGQK